MLVGTGLLKLPASVRGEISWMDAFFTSVSAVSVTGLATVDIPGTFTTFGQSVMIMLVQVGGLGIMTLTTLGALLVGRRVGFKDVLAVREEMGNVDSPRSTLRLVGQIAAITLFVELVGAVVLAVGFFRGGLDAASAAFYGVFHAIAAFCNAGFVALPSGDIFKYAGDAVVILPLALLIIIGGLGFPVMVELSRYRRTRRLTVHSRIVLITSGILLLIGVASVGALEWTNPGTLGGNPLGTKLWMSFFQGVTPRTAGFQTVAYPEMREPTLVIQAALMFIGAAPTSTGGGVRITTIALLALVLLAQYRGAEEVSVFNRRLPRGLVQKAFAVLSLSTLLVLTATFALMISDGLSLLPALFEVTSAFGTVGLTLDVTPGLSTFGKFLVIGVMFLGRVGPITLVLALALRHRPRTYTYPEEDIAIG
jgi:trk system potassium uptake protein